MFIASLIKKITARRNTRRAAPAPGAEKKSGPRFKPCRTDPVKARPPLPPKCAFGPAGRVRIDPAYPQKPCLETIKGAVGWLNINIPASSCLPIYPMLIDVRGHIQGRCDINCPKKTEAELGLTQPWHSNSLGMPPALG
jgi:hypothetical protein